MPSPHATRPSPPRATLRRATLRAVARELRLAIVCIEALKKSEPDVPGVPRAIDAFDTAHATRTLWLIERELQRSRPLPGQSLPRHAPAAPVARPTVAASRAPVPAPAPALARRTPLSLELPETPSLSAVFRRRLAGALAALSRPGQ